MTKPEPRVQDEPADAEPEVLPAVVVDAGGALAELEALRSRSSRR
jgi:hypothetical protein